MEEVGEYRGCGFIRRCGVACLGVLQGRVKRVTLFDFFGGVMYKSSLRKWRILFLHLSRCVKCPWGW